MHAVSIWAASIVVLDLLDMKGDSKELMQSTLTALIGIGEPGCSPAHSVFRSNATPSFRGLCKTDRFGSNDPLCKWPPLQCVADSHEYVFNDRLRTNCACLSESACFAEVTGSNLISSAQRASNPSFISCYIIRNNIRKIWFKKQFGKLERFYWNETQLFINS